MARRIWDTQDSLDRFFAVSELALASREFGSLTNAPMQATPFAFIADESDSGGLSWFRNQPAPTLYRLSDPTAAKHASFAQFQAAEALAGTTIDPAALALGQLLVAEAREHIGEEYYWSRRPDGTYMDVRSQLTNANYGAGPNEGWDCAEFVSWSVYQIYGKALGSTEAGGAFSARGWRDVVQDANLTIDIPNAEDARGIAGAIIVNKAGTHVAISLGNGHFIEANVDWNAELNTYYSDPGGRGATVTDWSTNPGTLAVSRYALFQDTPTGVDVGDVKINTYAGVNLQAQGWHAAILRPSGYQPPKPEATDLGNSFATATAKSLPYASQSARVGFSGDTDDYIVFTASSDGKVTVKLSELTADIDLRAYNASSSAAQIVASATRSNADETIEFNVLQGQQYWVRVDPNGSVASSYKLTVALDKNPVAGDKFGNSFDTAKKINVDEPVSDHVGHGADDDDYMWFTAPGDGYITATLSKMTQDLDLRAYDVNRAALGAAPEAPGTDDEAMTFKVKAGEKYYLRVDPDGNAESNFSLKLTFASGDKDNPDILSVTPTKGRTGVGLNDNIVVTFDETVQAGTGYIELFADGKTFEKFKVSDPRVTIAGGVVTIDPTKSFSVGTKYTVKIDEGAFKDAAGNKSDAITSSKVSFTTTGQKDTDNPDLESVSPTKDKKNVGLNDNITLNFDETVKAGTGYIEIFGDGKSFEKIRVGDPRVTITGDIVTIDPNGTFKQGTVYTAKIDEGAFVDAAGNKSSAITSSKISFTTIGNQDRTDPTLTNANPRDGATNVNVTQDLTLTFSETVVKGSGDIEVYEWSSGDRIARFDIGHSAVRINGSTVSVDLPTLQAGTRYYIKIDDGALKDVAGNKFDGLDKGDLDFTTAGTRDTTAPKIVGMSPRDGASNVGRNQDIVLTFSEAVVKGDGDIEVYKSSGSKFQTIDVSSSDVKISSDGRTVTINMKTLDANTKYYVKIDDGAFKDAAGNEADGLNKGDLDFTTGSSSAPEATDELPPLVLPGVEAGKDVDFEHDPLILPAEFEPDVSEPGPLILPAGVDSKVTAEEGPVICLDGDAGENCEPTRPVLDLEELGLGDFQGRDPHRAMARPQDYDWIV